MEAKVPPRTHRPRNTPGTIQADMCSSPDKPNRLSLRWWQGQSLGWEALSLPTLTTLSLSFPTSKMGILQLANLTELV